ncbi:MAG: hypothetical protein LBR08_04830 [Bacteroidales bacterium]|nr:hypothetical protein [Bacteroidales bacterium]
MNKQIWQKGRHGKLYLWRIGMFSVLIRVFCCFPVDARETTDAGDRQKMPVGIFGGFGFDYLEISSGESMEIGVHGGVIFNRWLSSGVYFNGIFTLNPLKDMQSGRDANVLCGHGGIFVAPIVFPNALVHVSFPVFAGYGHVNYELYNSAELSNYIESSCRFWMIEPGMEIEMNVLSFVRVAVGGYYKRTSKIRLAYAGSVDGEPILPENVLNGFSVGLKLRFGKF